jgi:HEAT repeat protein
MQPGHAGPDPAEKADPAMYENDPDTRFEAALRLSEVDPARGAEALRSIVADGEFDPDTRFEAAQRLSEVDPVRAAEALRSIVASDEFDPDTRDEAAHRLSEVDPAWADAFPG